MKRFALSTALLFACVPGAAWAAGASCTVSAAPVAFGTFNPFGSVVTATGTISVTCSGGSPSSPYTIALSTGGSGSFTTRHMSDGFSDNLNYNLYTSAAHTSIWGDGTSGTVTVGGTNGHTTNNFTAYGQLPTPQGVTPNSYTDTITVTVTY
ncbi:MAG TPA: spore coat U domain-containing protein [Micropepsaceae bacterium]|nr:spore coat U domain-containing protein [Micropepsaceae bacterium]